MEMQLTGWKANSQTSFKVFFSGEATVKEVDKPNKHSYQVIFGMKTKSRRMKDDL